MGVGNDGVLFGVETMKKLAVAAFAVVILAPVGIIRAADKPDPTGTWKWSVEVNGQQRESTLKLKLADGKLTGTMSRGNRDTEIADATFKDGAISFTVTRERNGNKFTTKYTGKLDGDTIKGKTEFERDGKAESRDWEAKRSKD
jgi:hypothetical protein